MVIPAPYADEMNIGAGDFLLLSLKNKKIVVEKTAFKDVR